LLKKCPARGRLIVSTATSKSFRELDGLVKIFLGIEIIFAHLITFQGHTRGALAASDTTGAACKKQGGDEQQNDGDQ
jgi:hypothetical protein